MYIGHRCDCGHTDLQHTGNGEGSTLGPCTGGFGVSCGKGCGTTPEPEVFPTFDRKARPIERIILPGDGIRSENNVTIVKTCPCDACVALHEQLASA